ncbi:trypsin-like serine protease [Roseimicrobium sp. ORNL1]|uniref:trypsin-like serine protease n=1 Tax=Roseimicrobium sp. ORNL1 TaxID=2711231 RepID=UPI0013E16DF8|nr:trypsin-like serine protease [Roseimicrobium sp. ORNL1]QIF02657.1 trypsin-like serine protease [Roseimicrobium sp. ORNL1]
MNTEQQLLVALDVLTEGTAMAHGAPAAFVGDGFKVEAASVHQKSKSWVQGAGIQGLGISEKISDGEKLGSLSLKVYVDVKKPESKLKEKTKVPKEVVIPGLPKPIPTDVEAIGVVRREANTSRVRPAIPGFSLGHLNVSAGTFGCLVQKTGNKQRYFILSNSHVLADEGLATAGDEIVQPGVADGGSAPLDVIAKLDGFVPFQFTASSFPNLVDAAIAQVKKSDVTSAIRILGVPKGTTKIVRRGMLVQKTGRTTDFTTGVIKDINFRVQLKYSKPGGGKGRVGFSDQVLCTRYTAPGDSGSAVLNKDKKIVGLHFAGSDSSSIFNKIENVLSALGIVVVTDLI